MKRDGQAVYSDTFGLVNKRTAKKAVLTSLSKMLGTIFRRVRRLAAQCGDSYCGGDVPGVVDKIEKTLSDEQSKSFQTLCG